MTADLSVSNLAWPGRDLAPAMELARALGFGGIEIAPHSIFGRWDVADADVKALGATLEKAGLACPALQGIMFDVPGAALFESGETRLALASHLKRVARMAGMLGARACVFGAPRQRDPGGLPPPVALEIAADFLRSIGPAFEDQGGVLAIEANARAYGCRFVTTTAEAIALVETVATPGIGLQIDTGTMVLESEDPEILRRAAPLAVHAHVSEPGLVPLGSAAVDHRALGMALKAGGYRGWLSVEMLAGPDWRSALRDAARLVTRYYA